jgi:hypothetical protein
MIFGRGKRSKNQIWDRTMNERPKVYCLAAWMYGEGKILRHTYYVTLEEAHEMKQQGFTIVGPDQSDLVELATWERQRRTTA